MLLVGFVAKHTFLYFDLCEIAERAYGTYTVRIASFPGLQSPNAVEGLVKRVVLARCRVKVALRHTYVVLRMRRLVRHMHDVCAIHIRRNCVHSHPKLLMV